MRRRTRKRLVTLATLVAASAIAVTVAPGAHEALVGHGHGYVASSAASPPAGSRTDGVPAGDATRALLELHGLTVSDVFVPGYRRDAFGQAWADTDRNGCDTRNDVLRHDLSDVVLKPGTNGCVVISGTLNDPYTGRTIPFHRGATSSVAVQIDHRYPLALAWRHGAANWTAQQRELFANDQSANLIAVDGPANMAKSASGPGGWMPPNASERCAYATSFVAVAAKWQLSVGSGDYQTLERTLTECEAHR